MSASGRDESGPYVPEGGHSPATCLIVAPAGGMPARMPAQHAESVRHVAFEPDISGRTRFQDSPLFLLKQSRPFDALAFEDHERDPLGSADVVERIAVDQ